MGDLLQALGQLFSPVGAVFHVLFQQPVYNVLLLIYQATHNLALSIVLLTLLIRACLIPLTRKQLKSSRAMQELQPKLKELQKQYSGDPQGLMAAQRELYKEHGVSPASGCLPLLIQMPVLYAMFFSFNTLLGRDLPKHMSLLTHINDNIYSFLPHLALLPNTHFLWLSLTAPDPTHILPILAGALTFLQLRMAQPVRKPQAKKGQPDPTSQATQTMQYMMPLMTIFFGWSFPAGMALYWCVGTLFSAVQQYFIAGWGSLFVGVPGMERFVPEPKDSQPNNLALASASRGGLATATAGGARGLVASRAPTPAPASEGGFRGLMKQFRATMEAAQAQQATARSGAGESKATVVESEPPASAEATNVTIRPATNGGANGSSARERRRVAKDAPMLVKPASAARAATSSPREDLPEVAIARDMADGEGRFGGGSRAGAGDAAPTVARPLSASAPAKRTTSAGRPSAGSATRKPANGQGGKAGGAARPRAGRAKGGR